MQRAYIRIMMTYIPITTFKDLENYYIK